VLISTYELTLAIPVACTFKESNPANIRSTLM